MYTQVRGTNTLWKFRGLIDGFNKLCGQIASGVEKTADESMHDI